MDPWSSQPKFSDIALLEIVPGERVEGLTALATKFGQFLVFASGLPVALPLALSQVARALGLVQRQLWAQVLEGRLVREMKQSETINCEVKSKGMTQRRGALFIYGALGRRNNSAHSCCQSAFCFNL